MKTREQLDNAGNNRGKDVICKNCGEPWEDAYIIADFTDHELEEYCLFDPHLDDSYNPDENEHTFIGGLRRCPVCDEDQ